MSLSKKKFTTFVAAFLAVLCVVGEAFAEVRRYAVVVGANIGDDDETPLQYAERDAKRIASVLKKLGGVSKKDLTVLLGPNATTVEKTLETIVETIEKRDQESLLFVYYSGHADARSIHLGGTRLKLSKLKKLLERTSADLRILVLDACRSGEVTRVKGGVPAEPFKLDSSRWDIGTGLAILTSAASGEDAQESERLKGSFFTHYFVSGLLGAADESKDGIVTLSEVYEYAYKETLRSTSRARFVQHPTYSFDIKGRRDLALTQIRRKNQDLGHLRLEDPGSYVIFAKNERGAIIAEVTVDKDAEIALSEGDYFVRRRYSGSLYESKVPIREDHTTTIQESDMKTVPMGRVARKGGEDSQGAAWSILAGGGVAGEVLPQTSLVTQGSLGLSVDLRPVTIQLRGRYGQSTGGQNTVVKSDIIGGDLSAMMGVDIGRLYLGAGIRGGGDVFIQSFPDQELENKRSSGARLSALGNVSVAITAWMSIFAEPAIDAYLIRVADEFGDGDDQQVQLSPSVIGGLQIYL